MKKKYYLIIIIGLLVEFSCNQTRTCPAFPDKYLCWLPYGNKQELKFSNLEDTLIFKVKDFEQTEEYKVRKKWDIACHAEANFITEKEPISGITLSGYCERFENSDDIQVQYNFGMESIRDEFIFTVTDGQINYATQIINNLIINNIEYENVICLKKDTTNNTGKIKDLFIVNSVGIIKFVERDGSEWILINE